MLLNKEQLEGIVKLSCPEDYSILVHGSGGNGIERTTNLGNKILDEGLTIDLGQRVVVSTAVPLGDTVDFDIDVMWDHVWNKGNPTFLSVIIAIPQVFNYSDGSKHFVGNFKKSDAKGITDNKDNRQYTSLAINDVFYKLGKVPREFILGYFISTGEDTVEYIENLHFINYVDEERQLKLFDSYRNMLEHSIDINTSPETIKTYIELSQLMRSSSVMYEQFLDYREKYIIDVIK